MAGRRAGSDNLQQQSISMAALASGARDMLSPPHYLTPSPTPSPPPTHAGTQPKPLAQSSQD